jgi:drug/metabolite transporter (DMT)-like permease
VFCTLIPIIFFIKAVNYIGGIKASLLTIVEPATTIALGIIFLGEHLSFYQCIGLILMAISIIVIESFSACKRMLNQFFPAK